MASRPGAGVAPTRAEFACPQPGMDLHAATENNLSCNCGMIHCSGTNGILLAVLQVKLP